MHLTPIRFAAFALMLAASSACGQVTGLSDDYLYDLEAGASSVDGGSDGGAPRTDAGDSAVDTGVDANNTCSSSQTVATGQRLSAYNGTTACKTCLAASCCNEVDSCSVHVDCNDVLSCKLDCTEKSSAIQRSDCFKTCTLSSGAQSPQYQSTVGRCAPASCNKECGF